MRLEVSLCVSALIVVVRGCPCVVVRRGLCGGVDVVVCVWLFVSGCVRLANDVCGAVCVVCAVVCMHGCV